MSFQGLKGFKILKIGFFCVKVLSYSYIFYSNHMHSSFIVMGLLKVIFQ